MNNINYIINDINNIMNDIMKDTKESQYYERHRTALHKPDGILVQAAVGLEPVCTQCASEQHSSD